MYNEELETLNKELTSVKHKVLAALADTNQNIYASLLEKEKGLLEKQKELLKVDEKRNTLKNHHEKDEWEKIKNERLSKSQNQIKAITKEDLEKAKVTIFTGYDRKNSNFTYEELFQKIKNILEHKKSFDLGSTYDGALSVKLRQGVLTISYNYFNQGGKSAFKIQSPFIDDLPSFVNGITIISCETEPLIENNVGHPDYGEEYYQYKGEQILRDLFSSFASALYEKD